MPGFMCSSPMRLELPDKFRIVHNSLLICVGDGLVLSGIIVQDGNTALMLAARNDHTESLEVLLRAGADMETKNNVRCLCDQFSVAGTIFLAIAISLIYLHLSL